MSPTSTGTAGWGPVPPPPQDEDSLAALRPGPGDLLPGRLSLSTLGRHTLGKVRGHGRSQRPLDGLGSLSGGAPAESRLEGATPGVQSPRLWLIGCQRSLCVDSGMLRFQSKSPEPVPGWGPEPAVLGPGPRQGRQQEATQVLMLC